MLKRSKLLVLVLPIIEVMTACGSATVQRPGATPTAASESTKIEATDAEGVATVVSSSTVALAPTGVQSDGSVCRAANHSDTLTSDQAVATTSCFCNYDIFSAGEVPLCFLGTHQRTWLHPDAGMGPAGKGLTDIPVDTLWFKPSLPAGLELEAVSTSDFGVSGTYPGLGRMIIAEVANDSLIGAGLQEQIALMSKLKGSVKERLTDDNPDNDATVASAAGVSAIVRFPQDPQTVSGQRAIEQVEWINGDTRFSVVIQLGSGAVLRAPTYDDSISEFISSFRSVA